MTLVSLETPVEELVEDYPASIRFLADRQIMCVVCGEAFWGSLGALIDQKGFSNAEQIVTDLNAYLRDHALES